MASYSGTRLPKKLGIKPAQIVALLGAPEGFDATLGELPGGVTVRSSLRGTDPIDVALLFVTRFPELEQQFPKAKARIAKDGGLWVCWPKKSSGVPTDLSDGEVREHGLSAGLVDNKVCAIDDTWSALRFVWRVEDR